MMMKWIIGVITLLGVLAGIYTFLKTDKFIGICQLILATVCPLITMSFLSLKEGHAFGGTDWEFLVHSATIDGSILPWICFILFVVDIICIVRTVCKIYKKCGGTKA